MTVQCTCKLYCTCTMYMQISACFFASRSVFFLLIKTTGQSCQPQRAKLLTKTDIEDVAQCGPKKDPRKAFTNASQYAPMH